MEASMRKTTAGILLLVAIALPLAGISQAAEDVCFEFPKDRALRYRFKKFFRFTYKAKAGKTNNSNTGETVFEFIGQGDGVRVQIREFKSKVVSPPDAIIFDSRKTYTQKQAEANLMVAVLTHVPGESFFMKIDYLGGVRNLHGFKTVLARSASRGLTGTDLLTKHLVRSFDKVFSESELQAGFDLIIPVFPQNMHKGMTWDTRKTLAAEGITLRFDLTYRVTSCKSKIAVAVTGPLCLSVNGQSIPKQGTIKGSAIFDLKKKRLVFSSMKSFIKLPNMSLTYNFEFKLEKELPLEEVGPLSFEKPLRGMLKLVERRVAVSLRENMPVPVYGARDSEEIAILLCNGDIIRVVGQADTEHGARFRIVTVLGREGWIDEKHTKKYE
jgi:hypothetical protein